MWEWMACVCAGSVGHPDIDQDVGKRLARFDVDYSYIEKLSRASVIEVRFKIKRELAPEVAHPDTLQCSDVWGDPLYDSTALP